MRPLTILLLTLVTAAANAPAAAAEDRDPIPVTLDEVWRVGEDQDLIFGVVADIEMDPAGTVYILDRQLCQVQMVSADGAWLGSMGREGEGPGEFRNARSLFLTPEGNIGVTMTMPGRIVMLAPTGEALDDLPLPEVEGGGALALGGLEYRGGNLVIYRFDREFSPDHVDQHISLQRVDPPGQAGVVYHRMFVRDIPNRMVLDETERGEVLQRWTVGPDGRVWFAEGYTDYILRVWDPDGAEARVMRHDVEPHRRSPEQIAERRDVIKSLTRNWPGDPEIRISNYDLTVRSFRVLADGGCWVLTSAGLYDRPPGSLGVWDVFDAEGAFTQQVSLIGEGDPERDALYFLGDSLLLVRGALDGRLSAAGGAEGAAASEEEIPPLEVVRYRLGER